MNTTILAAQYQAAIDGAQQKIRGIKKRLGLISAARLLAFLLAATALYICLSASLNLWLIPFAALLAGFLYLMRLQQLLSEKMLWEENIREHITGELELLQGKRSKRDQGKQFADPAHAFAHDLDIFGPLSLFVQLNRSSSGGGKRVLARQLLRPLHNQQHIQQQQAAHQEGATEQPWIWSFLALGRMAALDEKDENGLKSWMNQQQQEIPVDRLKIVLYGGPVLTCAFVVLWLLGYLPYQFPVLGGLAQVALVGHYLKKISVLHNELGKKYNRIGPLAQQLALVEKKPFTSEWLRELLQEITAENTKASRVLAGLSRIMARFDSRLNPIGAFLFNFLFLYDLHTVRKLYAWRAANGQLFARWLDVLFEMEAWASRSSFVFQHPSYCWPQVADTGFAIEATALAHPLMKAEKAVGNDFSMDTKGQVHLVTGSNMSGKSTFLRALGTNLVLAQNGVSVNAAAFTLTPVFLVSSMRINDSLEEDESYFYAEIKRLEQVMRWVKEEPRVFFLLDEILRGTNSRDKHAGSAALLEKLLALNANGMLATHDLALAELETAHPGKLCNFAFESQVRDNDLFFDYRLRKGVCQNLNAIFLMRKTGIIE